MSSQNSLSTSETSSASQGDPAANQSYLNHMPAGYHEVSRRRVQVDGVPAELIRNVRMDGRNAITNGEHFSVVIAMGGHLKGFARMDAELVGQPLPSQEEAEKIAMAFLQDHAPDLPPEAEIHWIKPHDETLILEQNGKRSKATLTGMKVKMRNKSDGLWMWVIVGPDRKVMVFERDINWISFPGHRGTEKWLHDSWLEARR